MNRVVGIRSGVGMGVAVGLLGICLILASEPVADAGPAPAKAPAKSAPNKARTTGKTSPGPRVALASKTQKPPSGLRVTMSGKTQSVWLGRQRMWRAPSAGHRIVTPVKWSRARDAVAFAHRDSKGMLRLSVVFTSGRTRGKTLSWEIPLMRERWPHLHWLGATRIGLGRSQLRPQIVASWRSR